MNFRHILVTRFNLPNFSSNRNLLKIDITCDEKYLDYRFKLFLKYTVPSVVSQSFTSFTWYVFFSEHTPDKYRNIMENLMKENKHIVAVYLADNQSCTEYLFNIVKRLENQQILTSRIDNDDAFAIKYIEQVRSLAESCQSEEAVFVFENGLQFDEKHGILSNYHFPLNHFTTILSGGGYKYKNILDYNHTEINHYFEVHSIDNSNPLWLEIIHDTNVSNCMRTHVNLVASYKSCKEAFPFDLEIERNQLKVQILVKFGRARNLFRRLDQHGVSWVISKIKNRFHL